MIILRDYKYLKLLKIFIYYKYYEINLLKYIIYIFKIMLLSIRYDLYFCEICNKNVRARFQHEDRNTHRLALQSVFDKIVLAGKFKQ